MALSASACLAFVNFREASSHFEALGKSERTITGAIFNLYASALDIETGERGFLVTGQDKYLEPYRRGAVNLEAAFNELTAAFGDQTEGRAAVDRLRELGRHRLAIAKRAIELTKGPVLSDAARLALEEEGKATMDRFRAALDPFRKGQLGFSAQSRMATQSSLSWAQAAFFVCFILGCTLLTAGFVVLSRRGKTLAQTHRALLEEVAGRQQADERGHESSRQLQTAVESCKIPMVIFDEKGRIRLLSEGWTTYSGYTLADIPTLRDWEVKALGKVTGPARETLEGSGSVPESAPGGEWTVRAKDGSQRTWKFFTAPLGRDDQTGARLLMNEAVDVTEQKRAEQALREMNRDLEQRVAERTQVLGLKSAVLERSNADLAQFASAASHDLQEPLRAVAGCVQLFERRYRGKLDPSADELIRMIVEGSARMKALVDGLLAYSRSGNSGRLEVVDTAAALQAALANLTAAVGDSKAEVTGGSLPCLRFHPGQFEQIFQNLVGNALKYQNGKPPKVQVSAQRQEDAWLFSVTDNGIGFDPQHAEKIFGIFQRLHTREEYLGTGIGLAIVKRIVERRGGKIWAQSVPGQGSTFTFSVPDREPEAEVATL